MGGTTKGFWSGDLGYRQAAAAAAGVVAAGWGLQFARGGGGLIPPSWPSNAIFLALFLGWLALLSGSDGRLVAWLGGVPFALVSMLGVGLLGVAGGVIPQTTDQSPEWARALGLDHVFSGAPFAAALLLLLTNLGLATFRRLRQHGPKAWFFSLRTCEIIRKSRARVEKAGWQGAREGASPQRAVTERATPPDGLFCSRPEGCVSFWLGLRCSGGARPLWVLPPPSCLGQAKNPQQRGFFLIISQVLNHAGLWIVLAAAIFGSGDMIRARMILLEGQAEAMVVDAAGRQGYLPFGLFLQRFSVEQYPAEPGRPGAPKRFTAEVTVLRKSQKFEDVRIEVNKPFRRDGWTLYLTNYELSPNGQPNQCLIEAVRDPWLPAVYTGIFLMLGGAVAMLFRNPFAPCLQP